MKARAMERSGIANLSELSTKHHGMLALVVDPPTWLKTKGSGWLCLSQITTHLMHYLSF